jgi:hypothetical protein
VFGPLLLSTTAQPRHAPRIDTGRADDAEGRRYGVLVFGTGRRARVIGWRGAGVPALSPWAHRLPRPLRPLACWLFAGRWAR